MNDKTAAGRGEDFIEQIRARYPAEAFGPLLGQSARLVEGVLTAGQHDTLWV
jgi:hypothetical protein